MAYNPGNRLLSSSIVLIAEKRAPRAAASSARVAEFTEKHAPARRFVRHLPRRISGQSHCLSQPLSPPSTSNLSAADTQLVASSSELSVPPATAVAVLFVAGISGEDPLVSKLRTQLGIIHKLSAPPSFPAVSCSVLGLFALFFFVGAAFHKLWTLRKRRHVEREVNDTWPQVPTSSFSLFLEGKDLQRNKSVEWVLEKLWKVYRPVIENWFVGLLQPVI